MLLEKLEKKEITVALVGLGYVGLPLAVGFAKKGLFVIGYDINPQRINELKTGKDRTLEVSENDLKSLRNITYTYDEGDLKRAHVFIITVPTPVDKNYQPDLQPVMRASEAIGRNIQKGSVVILESTVYPGVTEELVVPAIANLSGLVHGKDFFAGYSPERINPGDKQHTLENVVKVVSGSDERTLEFIDHLYKHVAKQTFRAKSIRVAEAAKVIENTQRDLNIALVNELAMLFDKLNVNIWDVLEAARTKWNFLDFKPGLVGGHCIPTDPYYLLQKSREAGFEPRVIATGREVNNSVPEYIVQKLMRTHPIKGKNILVLGFTFKENVPDPRSTLTLPLVQMLVKEGAHVSLYDPMLEVADMKRKVGDGVTVLSRIDDLAHTQDVVLMTVFHMRFKELGTDRLLRLCKPNAIFFDVRHALTKEHVEKAGITYLSL